MRGVDKISKEDMKEVFEEKDNGFGLTLVFLEMELGIEKRIVGKFLTNSPDFERVSRSRYVLKERDDDGV